MAEDMTGDKAKKRSRAKASSDGPGLFTRLRNWLYDSYNGLFKIVIQPQLPKARLTGFMLLSFVLGLIWAYGIFPTQFFNGSPSQMSAGHRDQYIKLIAGSYAAGLYDEQGIVQLLQRVENPYDAVQRLIPVEQGQVQSALQNIAALAQQAQQAGSAQAPSSGSLIGSIIQFIIAIVVFVLIINVVSLLWGLLIGGFVERFLARFRPETEADRQAKVAIEEIRRRKVLEEQMRADSAKEAGASPFGPPLMQRVSNYTKGRSFDDSFAIEDANDMFLGECGATVAKTIGDGNELAAVEIWLFDKEDFVRTLTKLLVSEHAYNDPVSRSELDAKVDDPDNDIIVARPGAAIILETKTLRLQAKIADMAYGGGGALPPNSFFEKLTIRMEAWEKAGAGVPAAAPMAGSGSVLAAAPMPTYAPPPTSMPPPMPSYTPPSPATQPSAPVSGGGIRPLSPPPLQQPPRPAPEEDDPFGGTGDFTPIGG